MAATCAWLFCTRTTQKCVLGDTPASEPTRRITGDLDLCGGHRLFRDLNTKLRKMLGRMAAHHKDDALRC